MPSRTLVAPLLVALVVLCGPAVGASTGTPAGGSAVPAPVSVTDPAGDVRIFAKARGLTRGQRTSIDLRKVTVTPGAGRVRFAVRLRAVPRRLPVDQMVFLWLVPAAGSTAAGRGEIGFSPQEPDLSYASHDTDGTGTSWTSCDPLRAKVRRGAAEVRLDVPVRCIPEGALDVRVETLTGYFRSDAARPWSRDRLRFPAPVVLRQP